MFYVIRMFTTVFTTVRHLPLSGSKFAHSTPSHPLSWGSVLILHNDVVHDLYTTQNINDQIEGDMVGEYSS